jgi:hypothetical protein
MPQASRIFVSCIMLWRSPTLRRLHNLQSNILKQHVADPEHLCVATPCQPTSCSILRIANRTLRQSLEVCLAADPGHCLRVIPWRTGKASSYVLSAASETPGTNPKAEGSRSSPISRRCKEGVPDSLDAGIFPSFGCDTGDTHPARATASTATHGWQSSQIICSTSFFVQLLCCSLFPRIPANNHNEVLQFDPS